VNKLFSIQYIPVKVAGTVWGKSQSERCSMGTSEGTRDSSARIQVIVAVIGLLGAVAAALISNWNHIFPKPASTQTTANSSQKTSPKKAERKVYSEGQLEVRGASHCNLDAGAQNQVGADFWWEQDTPVKRYLTPENGAGFFVMGIRDFASLGYADIEHLQYSSQKIDGSDAPYNNIPQGTVVAYRTSAGRLGKFVVVSYGYNLTIRWVTYEK